MTVHSVVAFHESKPPRTVVRGRLVSFASESFKLFSSEGFQNCSLMEEAELCAIVKTFPVRVLDFGIAF